VEGFNFLVQSTFSIFDFISEVAEITSRILTNILNWQFTLEKFADRLFQKQQKFDRKSEAGLNRRVRWQNNAFCSQ
jgi:hypothetical protein